MPFLTIKDQITLLNQCTTIKGQVLDRQSSFYMGNMVFQFQLHTDNLNIPLPEEERGVNEEMYIWNRKSREEGYKLLHVVNRSLVLQCLSACVPKVKTWWQYVVPQQRRECIKMYL